jgi:hypothetical protein
MTDTAHEQDWLLLVHLLPPKPTNLRVRIWRKLQKLGAVAIKNSIYVLPFNDKTFEDFQWLKQEIESASGEATVFRAGAVEGATHDEIIKTFCNTRNQDYSLVAAELDGLTGAIGAQKRGGHLSTGRLRSYEADLDRLHKELERIISIDFFQASGQAGTLTAYQRCRKTLLESENRTQRVAATAPVKQGSFDPAQFQGRRWATRKELFVDRLASVWLIRRFIDRRARFTFLSDGETAGGAITFDMYGAELSHQGEDCTFETMIKRFGLSDDKALNQIAELVHDIDLKDSKFNRLEAPGLNAIITGLAALKDDRELVRQTGPIFDGLYELFARDQRTQKGRIGAKQPRRARSHKRPPRPR